MKTTEFSKKVLGGHSPTTEDWMTYLQQAHLEAPSMTPKTFAAFTNTHGRNPYEILATNAPFNKTSTLLDLACGDGHLIPYLLQQLGSDAKVFGVDMSEGELEVARAQVKDPRVTFINARAQNMPLETASIDHAFSHMAFMLMMPIEDVVRELARVIRPGGSFSAVIPMRSLPGSTSGALREGMIQFFNERYPQIKKTPSGDERVMTSDGVKELFDAKSGFDPVTLHDETFETKREADFETVWGYMKTMYFTSLLPDDAQAELKAKLALIAKGLERADGLLEMTWTLRLIRAQRL